MDVSTSLSNYNIRFTNLSDSLICVIELEGKEYEAKITQSDLKLVSLKKIQKIIESNHKQIQPNYTIKLIQDSNLTTGVNYLVLEIVYSGDIDFDEKIIFTQSNTLRESYELKQLEQIERINKLEKHIEKQNEIIGSLKERLDRFVKEQFICMQEIGISNQYVYKNISKNVDKLELVIKYDYNPDGSQGYERPRFKLTYELFGEILEFYVYGIPVKYKMIQEPNYNNKFESDSSRTQHRRFRNVEQKPPQISIFDGIPGQYLFFNFNSIIIKEVHTNINSELESIKYFIDEYLEKRSDFVVELIETIYNKDLVPVLLKHSNYKKLKIKYDKEFDDRTIQEHCTSHNIEFGYIE